MSELLRRLSREERKKTRARAMPDWTAPMLAKLTHDPFADDGWIFERKLDGERVMAYVRPNGGVRLMSRNRKRLNDSYPEIEEALAEQAIVDCILDGEVVAFGEGGVSDFQKLQPRMHASTRRESERSRVKVFYYVFDCVYADGRDITKCALRSRKKILKAATHWRDPLRWTPHRNGAGLKYFREACGKGWEGVIAKDAGSPYVHKRSGHWLKFKCVMRQEFVVCGFTEPRGERAGVGALLLGFYRGKELVYAGKVGTGFDDDELRNLSDRLRRLERKSSPYDRGRPPRRGVHFVAPRLVCEVAFTGWTDNDRLRHPRYKGLRRDKKPRQVRKENGNRKAET